MKSSLITNPIGFEKEKRRKTWELRFFEFKTTANGRY